MAIYRFWSNPFCEDRSKTACWVSIDRSRSALAGQGQRERVFLSLEFDSENAKI
jgi:hypothetical protein